MEYFIITNRLTNLRRQIDELKEEFEINKQNKNSVDYITYLQMNSSIIDTQIRREIEFIKRYDNCFSEIDKGIHRRRCKQLNQILFDFENELITLGSVRNILWEEENGFDFEIKSESPLSTNYLENHLEIVKEFKEFIEIAKIKKIQNKKNFSKIETSGNKYEFKITLKHIALKAYYEDEHITESNAISFLKGTEFKSGKKLYQHFSFYLKNANRRANTESLTTLKNKIELFKEVTTLLNDNETSKIIDETKHLENFISAY